jgi:hypothetical protein
MMVKTFCFIVNLLIGYFIPGLSFDQDRFQMEIGAGLIL